MPALPAERGEGIMEMRTSLGLSPRLNAVRETLAGVADILPEREAGPLLNGATWALGHQEEPVPSITETVGRGLVADAYQATIFRGSADLVHRQLGRDRAEMEQIVKKAIIRGGPLQLDR